VLLSEFLSDCFTGGALDVNSAFTLSSGVTPLPVACLKRSFPHAPALAAVLYLRALAIGRDKGNLQICIIAGYLVFFMHCGFAMLSIGCVRAKFAKHISMLILVDACTSGIAFYLFGCASLLLCLCRR
jgi:Ammonium Transporter Family